MKPQGTDHSLTMVPISVAHASDTLPTPVPVPMPMRGHAMHNVKAWCDDMATNAADGINDDQSTQHECQQQRFSNVPMQRCKQNSAVVEQILYWHGNLLQDNKAGMVARQLTCKSLSMSK